MGSRWTGNPEEPRSTNQRPPRKPRNVAIPLKDGFCVSCSASRDASRVLTAVRTLAGVTDARLEGRVIYFSVERDCNVSMVCQNVEGVVNG